ncbi:hypothetical protein MHLP_01610 [Candidatus Mycoplasma haematolamae str. Purdue]|uniref:Uncharacterized protein n=1 Tax=Mycoplasma haematolamae (strain Purdue) TaxID=1212765 RepID=I7C5W2_MYCHA|nr:hypothetical protein [Candidatus Mycoplasma haematolamae]AFO51902.1 hypothetical protein MHLP_01610 [Candidatus Mycoplasma haematolamae str. Purdue]
MVLSTGKIAVALILTGGTSAGIVYPLIEGNGSFHAFFTGKTSQEVEGILLFTKSYYTNNSEFGRTYKLDFRSKEQWEGMKKKWLEKKEDFDPTYYIPVEIKDNNRGDQANPLIEELYEGLWSLIKKEGKDKEYEKLKEYVESEEVSRKFKSVFGEGTYNSLLEEIKRAKENKSS